MIPIKNLTENPFSRYSAEEELAFLNEIFYPPRYYNELKELLKEGVSRFILGQRGQGKSIVIYKLLDDLSKNHSMPFLISRYDSIPVVNNENHLLYLILQNITIEIAKHLSVQKDARKELTKSQKKKLSFLSSYFMTNTFQTSSFIMLRK